LAGIKDIWTLIERGHMAVAIGEHLVNERHLWLFRNKYRPLWLVDLRDVLGQIFFFSSPEIWFGAVDNNKILKKFLKNKHKIIELPIKQVWFFKIDEGNPIVINDNYSRFKIDIKKDSMKTWPHDKILVNKNKLLDVPVITELEENESTKYNTYSTIPLNGDKKTHSVYNGQNDSWKKWAEGRHGTLDNLTKEPQRPLGTYPFKEGMSDLMEEFDINIVQIGRTLQDINTQTTNQISEGSMLPGDLQEVIDSLETVKCELVGTLKLMEKT